LHDIIEPVLYENVVVKHYCCVSALRHLSDKPALAGCVRSFVFLRDITEMSSRKSGKPVWQRIEEDATTYLLKALPSMESLVTFKWSTKSDLPETAWQLLKSR
jgi:hypothetical protein